MRTVTCINTLRYTIIIISAQIGTGILILPRIIAEKAGQDGWISVLIGWVCSIIASIFFIQALHLKKNTSNYIFQSVFGKYIGNTLVIFYTTYFLLEFWTIFVNCILLIQEWLLPHTSNYTIAILLCIPTYMIVSKGTHSVGSYCEIVFYITICIPLLFLILIPVTGGSLLHFLPVLKNGISPVLHAVPSTIFSFSGFEISIVLYPYLQSKKYALHGVIIANTFTMFFYLLIVLISFYFFSPNAILQFAQPVLNLFKLMEFRFLERVDLLLLCLYLIVMSTSWITFLYSSILIINSKKTPHFKYKTFIFLVISILIIRLLNPSGKQLKIYQDFISNIGLWLIYCFSIFLWLYVKIYNRSKPHV